MLSAEGSSSAIGGHMAACTLSPKQAVGSVTAMAEVEMKDEEQVKTKSPALTLRRSP